MFRRRGSALLTPLRAKTGCRERRLSLTLANLYLQGKVEDGDVVKVSADKDGLIFNGEAVA